MFKFAWLCVAHCPTLALFCNLLMMTTKRSVRIAFPEVLRDGCGDGLKKQRGCSPQCPQRCSLGAPAQSGNIVGKPEAIEEMIASNLDNLDVASCSGESDTTLVMGIDTLPIEVDGIARQEQAGEAALGAEDAMVQPPQLPGVPGDGDVGLSPAGSKCESVGFQGGGEDCGEGRAACEEAGFGSGYTGAAQDQDTENTEMSTAPPSLSDGGGRDLGSCGSDGSGDTYLDSPDSWAEGGESELSFVSDDSLSSDCSCSIVSVSWSAASSQSSTSTTSSTSSASGSSSSGMNTIDEADAAGGH